MTRRERTTPESLKGIYTPTYAGDALHYFLNYGNFGTIQRNILGPALIDQLPMVKQGYALRITYENLFYIYGNNNNLIDMDNRSIQFITPDALMNEAFGGQIPASIYLYKNEFGLQNISMKEAVETKLIPNYLNTFEVIESIRPNFNRNRFEMTHLLDIIYANGYRLPLLRKDLTLAPVLEAIQRPEVQEAMINEHTIVKQTSQLWKNILQQEAPVIQYPTMILMAQTIKDARRARIQQEDPNERARIIQNLYTQHPTAMAGITQALRDQRLRREATNVTL